MLCPECEVDVSPVQWKRPDVIKVKIPAPHKGPCGLACKGGMMPSPALEGPFHVKENCVTCARKAARAAAAAVPTVARPGVLVQPPPLASPVPPPTAKSKAKA
jgi:hypothetical protein